MPLQQHRQLGKCLAALWVGLCVYPLPSALGITNGTGTDSDESADQLPVKKSPQIKSQSGKSLHNDAQRPRTVLPVREELAPETIDSRGLRGKASFYGPRFQGRKTASGDTFNNKLFTAASNLIPLGTLVAVKRPDTNLCVVVKVNDRMHPRHRARIIDLSQNAARYLDMVREGVIKVQIMKVPTDAIAGQTIDCTMGYEVEQDCENCNNEASPLQFTDH
jgi:rare lipoprotein A